MKQLLQLWHLLDSRQRRGLTLANMLALVMALFNLAGVAAVGPFFAVLAGGQLVDRHLLLSWLYRHLGFPTRHGFVVAFGMGLLGVLLLGNAINMLGSLALNRFAHRVGHEFCVGLFDEYLHRGLQFHLACNSATLFNNVIWEVSRGTTGMLQSFLNLVTNIATSALIIGAIVFIHPLIALIVGVALCGSYGAVYLSARQRLLRNSVLESRHTEERTKIASEAFGAIREIIVLNGQAFFGQRFAHSGAALVRAVLDSTAIAQSPRYILEAIIAMLLVGAALLAIGQGRSASDWLAQLSFLGFAAYRLLPALQQIFHGVVRIRGDGAAFSQIAGDLRASRVGRRAVQRQDAGAWQGRPRAKIELKDVQFGYADDRPRVIRGASFAIPAGSTVAFVGQSGSGKTSLAELLLGLLSPTGGLVEIDGIPLTADNCVDWQGTVAYVPQHVFLFDASLAENVALATEMERIDIHRMTKALRLARLEEFVSTLPHGHLEIVGEHGVRLSGGQRQRVGIARALYRRASLLVLDEPTSALDGLTESEVMETIEGLRGQCTIILIAHRVSTVRGCDLIFELSGGAIVAAGTYEQVARLSERFEQLLHGGYAQPIREHADPTVGAHAHTE